jgi:hypothetical protein
VCGFACWSFLIGNAAPIYRDGSLENISQTLGDGHKVRNFYNNIISPNAGSDVTIDTHAIAAANLMPWGSSLSSPRERARSASPTGPVSVTWEGIKGLFSDYDADTARALIAQRAGGISNPARVR